MCKPAAGKLILDNFVIPLCIMNAKARHIKARENWIKCYQELGSVSKAALK